MSDNDVGAVPVNTRAHIYKINNDVLYADVGGSATADNDVGLAWNTKTSADLCDGG